MPLIRLNGTTPAFRKMLIHQVGEETAATIQGYGMIWAQSTVRDALMDRVLTAEEARSMLEGLSHETSHDAYDRASMEAMIEEALSGFAEFYRVVSGVP